MAPQDTKIADAWRILQHNVEFSKKMDAKFGPVAALATAVMGLASLIAKDSKWDSGKVVDLLSVLSLGAALVFTMLVFWQIVSAISPSLTSNDTEISLLEGAREDEIAQSILYFGDICKLSVNGLSALPVSEQSEYGNQRPLDLFKQRFKHRLDTDDEYLDDLILQIVEVSKITTNKSKKVNAACRFLLWEAIFAVAHIFFVILANRA